MSALPTVCILAGGLGTRLGAPARETPKPLVEVAGEPFLYHQLRLLATHGAREVVLCVGHLGAQIESRVGSHRFGLRIAYSHDGPGLDGTLGAIARARGLLGERFLVLYGDTYLRLDYAAAVAAWRDSGLPAMMTVLRNEGRWDVSNAIYADGRVRAYDKHLPRTGMRWIDYGLVGLEQRTLALVPAGTRDLSDLLARLACKGLLCGFEVTERFFEIGTPAALAETDAFLRGQQASRVPAASRTRLAGQGLRFVLAGATVALVNIVVTTLLAVVIGLPFQVALFTGYGAGLVVHFMLQRRFVWAHGERFALSVPRQLGRYLSAAGAQYVVTAVSVLLLAPLLGLSSEAVYLIVAPLLTCINFLLYRNGIFHPQPMSR